ncbi:serine/threonine protein kinase, partial [Nonomuraea sp. NN258]|uniref:serine/threonine-protein kinase n=1 Tax=Nonomuraea antri TaxID=2730852 RepID=UPI001568227B
PWHQPPPQPQPPPARQPQQPFVLAGRYRLVERLGEGGAGTVWRALDETLNREVAVKQVRVPSGLGPRERAEFADRAIHEARSAGRLRDPAIVLVHDVVLDGDQPWIIMDLVTGRSLDQLIREHGPLAPAFVARVGLSVLSALQVAHAHGILHQDVKPANILIDGDGSAMLTDFGIAAPVGGQGDRFGSAGSPGYMAPERLNEQATGPASDLWSLGASLYAAVEGRPPFERAMPAAMAAAVLLHEPPFPARAGRDLGNLIMAMLAKVPATRPTADQVRAALTGAAPVVATPPGARRRWWLVPVVLAAAVLLGAGGWYGLTLLNSPKDVGRFAAAPGPCALLTDAQAAAALGGAVERDQPKPGECRWLVRDGSRAAKWIIVRAWAEQSTTELSGPQVAERRYAGERATRASAEGVQGRTGHGAVQDVPGVGESGFTQNTVQLYMNSHTSAKVDSKVYFRTSNALVEVIWHREDVPVERTATGLPEVVEVADRETVMEIGRLVSAALPRQVPPE